MRPRKARGRGERRQELCFGSEQRSQKSEMAFPLKLGSEHFCFRVARDAGVIGTEQMPDVSTRPGGSLSNAALFGFGPFVNENPNGHHPGSWQRIGARIRIGI